MITEDYVSFETAKLLKEKEFNGLCTAYYDCFTTDNFHDGNEPTDFNSIDTKIRNIVAAPTLQMAMKWLREVHNIHIEIGYNMRYFPVCISTKTNDTIPYIAMGSLFSYKKACEVAIKYCLENLI